MKAATKKAKPRTKVIGHTVKKKSKGTRQAGCMVPVGKVNGKTVYQPKPRTPRKK